MEERQDLISRQAAIDAVENEMCIFYDCDVLEKLKDLPPAQPNLQPTCNNLATDCISRQEAIDVAKAHWYKPDIVGAIEQLPSAQPEHSIAQERYEDLCEYFKDCSDQGRSILNDKKEFKSWLDRMKWHVMECNKLGRELEKIKTAQPEQQWVPCSERMPKEYEWLGTKKFGTTISDEVYVTFENDKGERFCKHLQFQNGELSSYDQLHMDTWYKGSKPIAWMPLPEPWRGEGNEHND